MKALSVKDPGGEVFANKKSGMNVISPLDHQGESISPQQNLPIQRKSFCSCDGGCPKCMSVQPKLKIGQPNDKYEKEADQVSDQVMRMPEPVVQKSSCQPGESSCQSEEPEEGAVQTKPIANQITPMIQKQEEDEGGGGDVPDAGGESESEAEPEEDEEPAQLKSFHNKAPPNFSTGGLQQKIQSMKGSGQPLSRSARNYFEPRFGTDFSKVRVHTGSKATDTSRSINAKAFTTGNNIVFNSGQYLPESRVGKELLAHELTHVVQQKSKQFDKHIQRRIRVVGHDKKSCNHKEKWGDVVIKLFNQLCPDTKWEIKVITTTDPKGTKISEL